MSTIRAPILLIIFLVAILCLPEIINAQRSEITGLADIDTTDYIPSFYRGALDYNLMVAASKGYSSEIERLIGKGADINAETDIGATPLVFAVSNNKIEAVNTLIYYNSTVNTVLSDSETPLLIAVKNRYFEIAEALIRAGADVDYTDNHGATPIHYASIYGYFDMVDLLLYYDASIEIKSEEGSTVLLASVWAGYPDITDLLIQNGANMETRDNDGFTPFLMASYYGDTLLMNLLYKKGVDIYTTNQNRHNALTLSIMANHVEVTKLLLQLGDKWSEKQDVINPYNVASKYRRKEVLDILEENNVSGHFKYAIDQITISASSRLSLHDFYPGVSLSFKEPFLNGGFIFGCDAKLWYSGILVKSSENVFYQYMDKGAVVYAGLFKDFVLTERPDRYNFSFSTSLSAGYSFGNKLKGILSTPENKFMAIPAISFKLTKMHLSFNMGLEYLKSEYYHYGPVWVRIGCSYNHYFDSIRSHFKTITWY